MLNPNVEDVRKVLVKEKKRIKYRRADGDIEQKRMNDFIIEE